MDKSREQFEAWFHGRYDEIKMSDHERLMLKTNQWAAWQASRAAVEIELDDKVMVEDEFDKGHNFAIDYCSEAIRAAGLKVKGE